MASFLKVEDLTRGVKSVQDAKSSLEHRLNDRRRKRQEAEKVLESVNAKFSQVRHLHSKMLETVKVAQHKVSQSQAQCNRPSSETLTSTTATSTLTDNVAVLTGAFQILSQNTFSDSPLNLRYYVAATPKMSATTGSILNGVTLSSEKHIAQKNESLKKLNDQIKQGQEDRAKDIMMFEDELSKLSSFLKDAKNIYSGNNLKESMANANNNAIMTQNQLPSLLDDEVAITQSLKTMDLNTSDNTDCGLEKEEIWDMIREEQMAALHCIQTLNDEIETISRNVPLQN